MLLLIFAGLRILVLENEMNLFAPLVPLPHRGDSIRLYLVGSSTFVRTEHDDIGRGVGELFGV